MINKSKSALFPCIFSISMFLLCMSQLIAQENGFYEIEINSTISTESLNKATKSDNSEFYDLTYKLLPTAYVENNNVNLGGNSGYDNIPVTKLTFHDTKSFNILNQAKSKFNNVELMTIKVLTANDLSNRID